MYEEFVVPNNYVELYPILDNQEIAVPQNYIESNIFIEEVPKCSIIETQIHKPCRKKIIEPVEYVDFSKTAISPGDQIDILYLTSGSTKESGEMLFQRLGRPEMWLIYISIAILYILFIASAVMGINCDWYRNLDKGGVDAYTIGILLISATIFSYGAIFMIWEHITPEETSIDFAISVYFMIGALLGLLWVAVFFQGNNVSACIWLVALTFVYYFWLFLYIWKIRIIASLFLLPLIMLYGYIFYVMVHLESVNHIPVS